MTAREQHIEDAARILSSYIIDAYRGTRVDANDCRAELRTAVEHIVDAATPEQPAMVKLQPGERDERD